MAVQVTTRRHMTVRDFPVTKDAQGRSLCRFCQSPVKPPRRTMCSNECVHEMQLRTNVGYLRAQVFKRDRGVCAVCGCDTEKIGRVLGHAARSYLNTDYINPALRYIFGERAVGLFKKLGWRAFKSNWEADHILPVSEGGGGCGLDNIRTLCVPCHKDVTREMHRRRRAMRRKGAPRPSVVLRYYERRGKS